MEATRSCSCSSAESLLELAGQAEDASAPVPCHAQQPEHSAAWLRGQPWGSVPFWMLRLSYQCSRSECWYSTNVGSHCWNSKA